MHIFTEQHWTSDLLLQKKLATVGFGPRLNFVVDVIFIEPT